MANMKTKDINFYSQFGDPSKKKAEKELIMIVAAGALVIVAAVVFVTLFTKEMSLDTQIDDLTAKTQDQTLLDKIQSASDMDKESKRMNSIIDVYVSNDEKIAEQSIVKDRVTDTLIMRLIECESNLVEVTSFSYSDSVVTLAVTSKTENEAASYVMRLRETNIFEWVEYKGFAGASGEYNYNITAQFETDEDTGDGANG